MNSSIKRRIEVELSDEDIQFITWMAKQDNVSFQEEMQMMFYTELSECKCLHMDDMKGDD